MNCENLYNCPHPNNVGPTYRQNSKEISEKDVEKVYTNRNRRRY